MDDVYGCFTFNASLNHLYNQGTHVRNTSSCFAFGAEEKERASASELLAAYFSVDKCYRSE